MAKLGEERTAAVGDVLFRVGDRRYPFIAIAAAAFCDSGWPLTSVLAPRSSEVTTRASAATTASSQPPSVRHGCRAQARASPSVTPVAERAGRAIVGRT
jgi:hypothetical protein